MKAKKQWMSLLGAVMMAATLVFPATQTVQAADKPVVSASVGNVTSAEVGDIISIPITFTSDTANLVGIHGEATNNYDSSVLEFLGEDEGVEWGDNFQGGMSAVVNANFGYVTTKKYAFASGSVTMKFKVLKCSENPVTVSIKNVYFTSSDFLDSASVDLTSTITINHPQDQKQVSETPATCQSVGHRTVTCGVCGTTLEDVDLPMTEHSWGAWEYLSSDDEPTCTKVGIQHRKCTVCGTVDTETKEVPMVDHKYDWTTEKEATCTEKGLDKGICSVCQNETTRETAAKGHSWKVDKDTDEDGWKVVTEATLDKEGSKERVCSVCGEKETAVIEKLTPTPTPTKAADNKTSGTTSKTSGTTSKTSGTKSSTTSTGTAVKTGDTFAPVLYVGLILAAACGITGTLVVKRRKNH